MNLAERIWWLLTMAAVLWYLTVTVYVSIRGALDIRNMLARLEEQRKEDACSHVPSPGTPGEG
jgi:hypothetical protein